MPYHPHKPTVYGAQYVSAELIGSGWAAIHHIFVEEEEGRKAGYWDIWNTGAGRYSTREEADREAQQYAKAEGIEYRPTQIERNG